MERKSTILIVEDESIVAEDIKQTLFRLGYDPVGIESTGEEAITAALSLKPDLILMDIMLKGDMTGIEAAKEIRDQINIPMIYLTAYADQNTLESAKKTQPYGYILKPFEEQDLTTTVEMALYKFSMEAKLKESEHLLSTTLHSIDDAVFTTDTNGIITFINDAAMQMAELEGQQSIGSPFSCLELLTDPDTGETINPINAVLSAKNNSNGELMLCTKSGVTIPVSHRTTLIKSETERTLGVVLVLRDNTEQWKTREILRASEKHYRNLVEHTPIAIIIHKQEKVVFLNKAALLMFHADNEKLVLGKSIYDFIDTTSRSAVKNRVKTMREEKLRVPVYEERFITLDGKTFDVEVSAGPIVYENEPAIVVAAHDITDRTRLEEELRQSHKMEAIGRLAGGIAHDFNNLLTAIIGYSDLGMAQLRPEDPLYDEVDQIGKAAGRAADLTRQLLAFSRRQVLQPRVINLNSTIREMEKLLRRVIGENIELNATYCEDLSLTEADSGQIQQVIMNLAINARDAMPEGGRLSIRTTNTTVSNEEGDQNELSSSIPKGDYIRIDVEDSGIGMSRETIEHMFEPFYTTKEQGEGTGLGLSTVYGIIKQSRGEITVSSKEMQGTTFSIFLPASEKEPVEEKGLQEKTPESGTENILIVEDEDIVRSLATTILSQSGYNVLEATNGKDALQLIDHLSGKLDLLITDVIMPGINGKELKEKVSDRFPEIKIIFMSGYSNKWPEHEQIVDKNTPFLQKPFTLTDLTRKVREVLDENRNP